MSQKLFRGFTPDYTRLKEILCSPFSHGNFRNKFFCRTTHLEFVFSTTVSYFTDVFQEWKKTFVLNYSNNLQKSFVWKWGEDHYVKIKRETFSLWAFSKASPFIYKKPISNKTELSGNKLYNKINESNPFLLTVKPFFSFRPNKPKFTPFVQSHPLPQNLPRPPKHLLCASPRREKPSACRGGQLWKPARTPRTRRRDFCRRAAWAWIFNYWKHLKELC